MKILKLANLVLLTLLSLASAAAKIMQAPQDMKFFGDAGFSETGIILFGIAQLAGGLMLVFPKTRRPGALIMALTFAISAMFIFMSGNIAFGLFSLLPVLMAGLVIREASRE